MHQFLALAPTIQHSPPRLTTAWREGRDRRMRLLVVSQVAPNALCHGSGLRMYHLLRHLQRSHDITQLCADNYTAPPPLRGAALRMRAMLSLKRPYPFQPDFQKVVEREIRSPFDAILLFGAELLQYLPETKIPAVVDLIDEPFLATLRELPAQRGLEFLRTIKHALSLIPYERRLCRRVEACLVVSAENARSFTRLVPGVKVVVLPNGVDADFFRPAGRPVLRGELVFTGNMSFPPNVAACLYFAQKIFPAILGKLPDAHWTIVGSNPHPSIQKLARHPSITVAGFVPDIRPYIEQAAVVVSPLISGGGIKNKVLEAWAMRKGIVATPLGCAGVDAHDEQNLLIATEPAAFAAQTLRLIGDPALALSLGEAGHDTVLRQYAWQDKASSLESLLQAAVSRTEEAS